MNIQKPQNETTAVLMTPAQAARSLALGRTTIFALMRSGALKSIRIGGARRIPIDAVRDFVAAAPSDRRAG